MQFLWLIAVLIWIAGLVSILRRRDIDIHDKLTWVVVILLLNALGAILYFIFVAGPRVDPEDHPDAILGPDAEPFAADTEWDPIRGEMWKPRPAADDEAPEIDDEKTV